MALSKSVENQLTSHGLAYNALKTDPSATQDQLAEEYSNGTQSFIRAVVLGDSGGTILAIMRHASLIDFSSIKQNIGRNLKPIPLNESQKIFPDCEHGCIPPIQSTGIDQVLIDRSLELRESVVFESGRSGEVVQLPLKNFLQLHSQAKIIDFTTDNTDIAIECDNPDTNQVLSERLTPDEEKQEQLKKLYSLPAMPKIAQQIILLRNDPLADAQKLGEIIQLDPSLTAQVLRYARSAYYGYKGEVNSVQEAISRVLGFDLVMNMAFGLSAGKSLRNPPNGPLGLHEFWKHATFSAALAQKLSRSVSKTFRPNPSMAYLCGLLHNFGFLVLGHLFQPEFFLLNRLYASNPNTSIQCIERHALGMGSGQDAINMGHAELGAWLMEHWELPHEVVVAVKHHHNDDYDGDAVAYPILINIVNSALGIYDIGDDRCGKLNEALCVRIGLDPTVVLFELDKLIAEREQLESIAMQFAA